MIKRLNECMRIAVLLRAASCCLQGQCDGHAKLDDIERAELVIAAQGNRSQISVELLAGEGCFQVMLDGLHSLGASERFTDAKAGYAWVMLRKEKVLDIADLPGVSEAYASTDDNAYKLWEPPAPASKPDRIPQFKLPIQSVATSLPPDGPFFPQDEAGLTRLWKYHPAADGRGVRVALFDDGLDLFHPALTEALDTAGNPVAKVADILAVSHPDEAAGWVQFGPPFKTTNQKFEAAGRDWTAPYDGSFRFGLFKNAIYLGSWFPEFSRGEAPIQLTLSVGVLWDEASNHIWIDTNGDGSFADQKALGDYGQTHDLDYFGEKSAEGDNRLPFGVKIDRDRKAAYVSLTGGSHAAAVAGTLAANRLTGGLYDGGAPNAQLIDVRGSSLNGKLPPVIASLARGDVDLVNHSGVFYDISSAGIETDFARHVLDRATTSYNKPVSCYCYSTNSLLVSDYQSAEMIRRNRQTRSPYLEAVNGPPGPDSDGLLNELVAPSAILATQSRYSPIVIRDKNDRTVLAGVQDWPGSPAPDGYWIGSNPSPTIPYGAAVMADLMSEARQQHVRYDTDRLIQAVLISSRLVQRFPTVQQGHGVIDAGAAWDQLQSMSKADDPATAELTSFLLEQGAFTTRHKIEGFRCDFPAGKRSHSAQLWVTRRGGYPGSRLYRVGLRGDDGTFHLLTRQVNLIQKRPALLRFSFTASPGQHLAFIQLVDTNAEVVMKEIPLFVRMSIGEPMAPGVDQYRATIPPLSSDFQYLSLDPKVQAARFVMRIPNSGRGRYSDRGMPGFMYDVEGTPKVLSRLVETKKPTGTPMDPAHHVGPMEEFESLIANDGTVGPFAGDKPYVYSIFWSNGGGIEYATPYDDPLPDVPITGTLEVRKYAVSFTRAERNLVVNNQLSAITGRVELYRADVHSTQLDGSGNHAQLVVNHDVPEHTAQWRIRISSESVKGNAADAFVFHCGTKDGCQFVTQKKITKSGDTVAVDDPEKGTWRIIVRARDAVTHPVSYQIREALLESETAAFDKIDSTHAYGASWTVALPASEHTLYAAFRIAGTPGKEAEKNGLRVAMTPLMSGAP